MGTAGEPWGTAREPWKTAGEPWETAGEPCETAGEPPAEKAVRVNICGKSRISSGRADSQGRYDRVEPYCGH
eukprot:1982788-Pyramimonas_sp.AAC.2